MAYEPPGRKARSLRRRVVGLGNSIRSLSVSVYSEQRRLMAEFENRGKRADGAPSGAKDENSALAELSRFVDAQKNRAEQTRQRRGRPSAEIRRESSTPAERAGFRARKRYVDDDFAPIDAASARAGGFREGNAAFEPREDAFDYRAVDIGHGPPRGAGCSILRR